MIARQMQVNLDPERFSQFKALYEKQILPIIRRQPGFLDELSLVSEGKFRRHVVTTLWRTRTDADNYQSHDFNTVLEMLKPFLTGTPTIEYFTVEHSTFRRIESVAA